MANTSSRALRLLSLLQTHRFWPGGELADRLEVSERTLRRDIDRLRELGYPVNATRGADGGYQLGAGAAMPPLTVEEDEAIAMAVALGNAAHQGSGALAEASLSALSKVVQVLPAKLKRRAEALRSVTVDSPFGTAPEVSAEVLSIVAQTIRDEERLRFRYTAKGGAAAGEDLGRHVEPHQLVTVGRRWYLAAYDLERQDWRSFRLDRLSSPMGTRARFRRREIPTGDAASFVQQGLSQRDRGQNVVAVVHAPAADVEARIGQWAAITPIDATSCRVTMDASQPQWPLFGFGWAGAAFEVEEAPDAFHELLRDWAERFTAATAGR